MAKEDKVAQNGDIEGGKFLTFKLHGEEYGLEILKVREIIGVMEITNVPQTPGYVKGVINLRGKVIPVVDLRLKFGFEETEYDSETCIIVVDVEEVLMGIVVDTVSEVVNIDGEEIEPSPSFGGSAKADFILGMGKVNESVKILLDIDKVLTSDEFVMMEGLADESDHHDKDQSSEKTESKRKGTKKHHEEAAVQL